MNSSLLASQDTVRPMLRLALPVMAEESLTLLVGYTDWWLTGHFLEGVQYKAAMGLMAYALWLLPSMFSAIAIGATAMTARLVGAGEHREAQRVASQSLVLGSIIAVFATLLAYFASPWFVSAMQLEGEAAELAVRYLRILSPAIPLLMVEQVAIACLHGAGDTVSGFFAKSIVNIVNMGLSASLVIGLGGLPHLGWEGLAIGTACGHALGGALLLGLLCRGRAGLQLRRADLRPDPMLIRRLLRVGIPGGLDILLILTCHLIYVAIINRLGAEAAAAHGLGVQMEALAFLPGSAFQVAAGTLTGQFLGARQPGRATRSVLIALLAGGTVMSVAAAAFYFGGLSLTSFFTGDPRDPTAVLTAHLLKIAAVSTPFLAMLMVLNGALRGAGDTRVPLLVTLVGFLGVRLPGACLVAWPGIYIPLLGLTIPGLGWGVAGAWWAMAADVMVRSLLVLARFLQGGWKKIDV